MKFAAIIALSIASMTASAQAPKLSMQQLIPGGTDYLYPQSLLDVEWKGNVLTYSTRDSAFSVSTTGKLLSQMTLAEADSLKAKSHEHKTAADGNGTPSADGQWTTLNDGDKLYVVCNATAERQEVSDDTQTGDIVWGQAVHRNEFGIMGGLFWAPQGHRLAFYRMDETMVQGYPLVDTDAREAEVKMVKYPMAGMTSHQVTLGVYDPDTRQTVYMKTAGPDDHYLTCITWRPDGRQIFIAELNREQNRMELNAYDAQTGDLAGTLFTETDAKYVEPEHPLYFLPGSNDRFIWQSERDGYNHLYLYDLSKPQAAPRRLTQGDWLVTEIVGTDAKGKTLFYTSTAVSPIENHLYALDIASGKSRRLTTAPGWHRVKMNAAGTAFYDVYADHTTPRRCQIVEVKSGKTHTLLDAPDPYAGYAVPEISVGTLKAADDSTDLYYRLVKPTDFDPTRRYPVVVYLYNGPHAQMVTEGWNFTARGWDIHMANLGYIVFTIDGRGSENRGLAFEQAIWHNLGDVEGKDQMRGIAYLKTLPYVDADRIGIHGWSYGGFMTTYMMLHYPETFKVGVAGGPVLDWSRYEVMYGERYMGTPQSNPDGYKANCLIEQAGRLRGRLLLIHDDQDATVVPQHSMQFLKTAIKEGTYPDYFMYPGHEHNVRGIDRVHLHEKITRYFEEHLK